MTLVALVGAVAGAAFVWYRAERHALDAQYLKELAAFERGYLAGWADRGRLIAVLKPGDVVVTSTRRTP